LVVNLSIELDSLTLAGQDGHAISTRRPVGNWCLCSPGKNL
jgi:hypothetical protein